MTGTGGQRCIHQFSFSLSFDQLIDAEELIYAPLGRSVGIALRRKEGRKEVIVVV